MAEQRAAFEASFGRLGTGASQVRIGPKSIALEEVMHRLGLGFQGNRVIDAPELGEGHHAIRYFDGEDRRIVCYEFADDFSYLAEHRVHIAEWLGDEYFNTEWDVSCAMDFL